MIFYFWVEFELGSLHDRTDNFGNVAAGEFVWSVDVASTKARVICLRVEGELLLVLHLLKISHKFGCKYFQIILSFNIQIHKQII